jgi:4-hydroxy-4-methyl-2-oxoglutarate aldolase
MTESSRPTAASLHEAAGRTGSLPPRLKPVSPSMRLWGPARPVRCAAGENLAIHHGLARAEPGEVLVVAVEGDGDYGYFGEVMGESARQRGLAGLVIDGCVRDHDALLEVGLPVFSKGLAMRGTVKRPELVAPTDSVLIGDVRVATGDLVVGDADGVVCIAADRSAAVVDAAVAREADERRLIEMLRAGATTVQALDLPAPE